MPKLIKIECPPDIFDVEDAYVMRRKRVPVYRVDQIRQAVQSEEAYDALAFIFPEWEGIVDVETGEPMPNPSDDPSVFGKLDRLEQLPWFAQQIQANKNDPNAQRSRRGRK